MRVFLSLGRSAGSLLAALLAPLLLSAGLAGAAGLQSLEVTSLEVTGGGAKLVGAVWYPCAAPPGTVKLRWLVEAPGVRGCPVSGRNLPLVVMSHGARGWFGGHHDTAAALADAGYVVAALTHPDRPGRGWQRGRPAAVKSLIDHMLTTWPDRGRIDGGRIGFFGFSRGGYTGLVLIGGKPDFRRFVRHCREIPDDPVCRPPRGSPAQNGAKPRDSTHNRTFTHDTRIKAAVIAAPVGLVFSPAGLRKVTVPVQLWRPEHDAVTSHPYNAEAVFRALPVKPDYRVAPGAGHFAIMAPCGPALARAVPRICKDPPGFDRTAFHKTFNAGILAFFQKHLKGS